ncbi:hypothetical protein QG37_03518 [Candidozyma auris]|uniref:Uncharacterized protein n=1 Tax=Candidozyma auris TaxID=498019 RepID=A0A0L0NYZ1_CANAR|nr:hypothetical protein QG37_03518 [[Candida] auris]
MQCAERQMFTISPVWQQAREMNRNGKKKLGMCKSRIRKNGPGEQA